MLFHHTYIGSGSSLYHHFTVFSLFGCSMLHVETQSYSYYCALWLVAVRIIFVVLVKFASWIKTITSKPINPNNMISDDQSPFSERVETLQKLASFQIASTLWMNIMLSGKYHNPKDTLRNTVEKTAPMALKLIKQLLKLVGSANSPAVKNMKDKIVRSSCAMRIEFELWMYFHEKRLLPGRKVTLYSCHLKCCVWKPSGSIDFKESARKMISMGYFGDTENFEIMSKFCMQDDLNQLTIDDNFRKFRQKLSFNKTPVAFYWHCKLTNEMNKIPRARGISLESYIISLDDVDNWDSMTYFFDLLTEEDQVKTAIELLKNPKSHRYIQKVLFKMNESQRNQLFSQIPVEIMLIFFRQSDQPTDASDVWMKIKDQVTVDQFCDLLVRLFRELMDPSCLLREDCIPLAKTIWNSVDDQYKRRFVADGVSARFLLFRPALLREFDPDLEFQRGLLSFTSAKFRKSLIFEMGHTIFAVDDFSGIDKLLELCLPKPQDLAKFKKSLPKSFYIEERTESAFKKGQFGYLNEFFDRYFPTKAKIVEFKKDYLETFLKYYNAPLFDPKIWQEFENFVDTADTNESYRNLTKKNFIRKFKLEYFRDKSNTVQLDLMEKLVARFLTDEEAAKLKKKLLVRDLECELRYLVEHYLLRDEKFFDGNFLTRLVTWCAPDEESLSEFKQWIRIDEIFSKAMIALMSLIRQEGPADETHMIAVYAQDENIVLEKFVIVDNFLKLYLNDDEAVKEYKLRKIFAFENVEFFKLLAQTAKIDGSDVKMFLNWLLSNDQEQICKFKNQCKDETIVSVL